MSHATCWLYLPCCPCRILKGEIKIKFLPFEIFTDFLYRSWYEKYYTSFRFKRNHYTFRFNWIQLFQLRLSPEQSGKVEYERERLLGIANKFIHLLAIPRSFSRSYSTFPLCSGDNLNWNSCTRMHVHHGICVTPEPEWQCFFFILSNSCVFLVLIVFFTIVC